MRLAKPLKIPRFLLLLILISFLAGCGKITWSNTNVGILSADVSQNSINPVVSIAREQKAGYTKAAGMESNRLKIEYALEDDPQNEIQVTVRNLSQDAKKPVVAMIGATANDATMQVAGLVNFFNVPMLIPTADGNSLLPANNMWAFRLSAPASAYAQYFFNEVLNQTNLGVIGSQEGSTDTGLSVAILYEQNTFGESAAVATAEAAMTQGISIAFYGNFPAESPSEEQLTTLSSAVKAQKPVLVYLISGSSRVAEALVRSMKATYISDNLMVPLILGQAGAFTSQVFLSSPESDEVYVLRQLWNIDNCPAEITTYYEAQSYAATSLLNDALKTTADTLALDKAFLSTVSPADKLAKFRETLRDYLKSNTVDVPCIGNVAFDNTGQNKLLKFEIVELQDGKASVIASTDFLKLVINTVLEMNAPLE